MKKILIIAITFSLNSFASEMIGGGGSGSMIRMENTFSGDVIGGGGSRLANQFNLSNLTLEDIKSITTKDGIIILRDEIINVDSQHNYYDHLNKIKSFLLQNGSSIKTKNIGQFHTMRVAGGDSGGG